MALRTLEQIVRILHLHGHTEARIDGNSVVALEDWTEARTGKRGFTWVKLGRASDVYAWLGY